MSCRNPSRFNLTSPNQIRHPCLISDLEGWFNSEVQVIPEPAIRETSIHIVKNLEAFIRFPLESVLLWRGCDRVPPPGQRVRYHEYPRTIKDAAKTRHIYLDGRPNGPAIASFFFGGGQRPQRFGSSNCWSIHHLYSGKFPYPGKSASLHAPNDGLSFTQSAGLIAVHPFADALADEFPAFAWLLRAHAFLKFGYDPDGVLATEAHDDFGFVGPHRTEILFSETNA